MKTNLVSIRTRDTGHYLRVLGNGGDAVMADADEVGPWERLNVVQRDVANVVSLVTTSGYVLRADRERNRLVADATGLARPGTTFFVKSQEGGVSALKTDFGTYVSARGGGGGTIEVDRVTIGGWELFNIYPSADAPSNKPEPPTMEQGWPFVTDFRGPLPGSPHATPMASGYLSPLLPTIPDPVVRQEILARTREAGAIDFMVMARCLPLYPAQGWSGPREFDALRSDGEFIIFDAILDEIITAGMRPSIMIHHLTEKQDASVEDLAAYWKKLVDNFGDVIAWGCPEFESNEARDASERAELMAAFLEIHPRCALHFDSHMPTDSAGYRGLPSRTVIWGQVHRTKPTSELRDHARATTDAAGGLPIIAFEHSRDRDGDGSEGQSVEEQTARVVELCRGGWRYTANGLSYEARIRSCTEWRPPSNESLVEAMPDIAACVPGAIQIGEDTIWHEGLPGGPGIPGGRRIDLLPHSRSRWQYLETDWDGKVRPFKRKE